MNAKVTLLCCLVTVAVARPDKLAPTGYGYSAPANPFSYAPPAPAYEAPEPVYHAPTPTYGAPKPVYKAPAPAYQAPEPVYEAPAPTYGAPKPSYKAPVPAYKAPEPVYEDPAPAYHIPEPVYESPAPAYKAPEPLYEAPSPSYKAGSNEEGMPFDFSYEVRDSYKGVDFGHDSDSDGRVVNGEYHVVLPDGRTQFVTYTADHYNGYKAEVTYEGEAKYPEPKPYKAPAPAYSAPSPSYEKPNSLYGAPTR